MLYVIRDKDNNIFAISEDKRETGVFFLQNNYNQRNDYTITPVKDRETINRIQIMFYDFYITEFYEDYYVRFCDIKPIMDMIYSNEEAIHDTIETLTNILLSNKITKNSIIESTSKTINYLSKHIKELTNVYDVIKEYYNSDSIMTYYKEYDRYLNVFC